MSQAYLDLHKKAPAIDKHSQHRSIHNLGFENDHFILSVYVILLMIQLLHTWHERYWRAFPLPKHKAY